MAITSDDLRDFQTFAALQLAGEGADSMYDLVLAWHAAKERDSANAAIREGLADIESGRHRPAEEFLAEMRAKYNFAPNA